ncbi:MAG: hypothetical protein V1908_04255 [Candidatus Peregrinibacteria bacterium]
MKKIIYIILSIILIVFLVDLIFVQYLFISKEIKPAQEAPFDNSCKTDEDCIRTDLEFACSDIASCGSGYVDWAEDKYSGFNESNFYKYRDEWREENNCPNALEVFGSPGGHDCPQVIPVWDNNHFIAACKNNKCTKIRGNILKRLFQLKETF